jgi:hypothetical protein
MNEPILEHLIRRLDYLERQNRVMKIAAIITLIVATAAACEIGTAPKDVSFKTVKAQSFVLTGHKNEVLGVLGMAGMTLRGPAANIILRNVDENDSPHTLLVADPLQFRPYISLVGRNGAIRLDLGIPPTREKRAIGPFLSIDNGSVNTHESEEDIIELSLSNGRPSLNLYRDKNMIWTTP